MAGLRVEDIVLRLERVRQNGPHEYAARCPAHEDRVASFCVKEADDGRILMHCFAGCSVHEVMSALGLEFSDLFPEPLYQHAKGQPRRSYSLAAVWAAVQLELVIAAIGMEDALAGKLKEEDAQRVRLAIGRLIDAAQYV